VGDPGVLEEGAPEGMALGGCVLSPVASVDGRDLDVAEDPLDEGASRPTLSTRR
jgi:hypothetical protein